jgi:hypothetical protein
MDIYIYTHGFLKPITMSNSCARKESSDSVRNVTFRLFRVDPASVSSEADFRQEEEHWQKFISTEEIA